MRLQGVQETGPRTDEEPSGPYASRRPLTREPLVLEEDEPPDSAEQNCYGLWGALFDSAEQEACLVVMSIGGRWPSWLSDELPGKSSCMIVVQQPDETVLRLTARARKLVSETTSPVRNVIWLRATTEVDDTWALELVSDLDDLLPPDCRIRVSGGRDGDFESLPPELQNQENQPLARHQGLICENSADADSFVA